MLKLEKNWLLSKLVIYHITSKLIRSEVDKPRKKERFKDDI